MAKPRLPKFKYVDGMTVEEFRRHAIELIDDALGHSWFVRGDNRKFLQGLRSYVPTMPEAEVRKLLDSMPN